MEASELDEGMKILDSCLTQINWRLKPSTKRRLQLDVIALCTRMRAVVMIDYGGIMPQLQHQLTSLLQLVHKESPIFENLKLMVIQHMIYLIHVTELTEFVASSFDSKSQLLFVDLEDDSPKVIMEIEKSELAMQFVSIQKLFLEIFSPNGINNPSAKCTDEDDARCSPSHSSKCIDLSHFMDNTDITVPTLNGFAVPYSLSTRGSKEEWAEAFLAHMQAKWERCPNAFKSLKMEVSECHPQAIVL